MSKLTLHNILENTRDIYATAKEMEKEIQIGNEWYRKHVKEINKLKAELSEALRYSRELEEKLREVL